MIIKSERLREAPGEPLAEICKFLEVDPLESITIHTAHSRSYPEPMRDEDRAYLADIFEHEIRQVERTLGWDCSDWLDSTP